MKISPLYLKLRENSQNTGVQSCHHSMCLSLAASVFQRGKRSSDCNVYYTSTMCGTLEEQRCAEDHLGDRQGTNNDETLLNSILEVCFMSVV